MTHRLLALLCLLTTACNVAPGDPLVAPDSPVESVEARGTDGALFVEVEGPLRWPPESLVRVQLDAFDEEDQLIEEFGGRLRAQAADDPQRQVLWWQSTRRPATLAVRVLLDGRVVFSHRIESIDEVPPAEGGRCDSMGARDHCGMGRLCWPVHIDHRGSGRIEQAGRFDGQCLAVEARAWRADPRDAPADPFGAIDLRAPDAADAAGPVLGNTAYPEPGSRRWSGNISPAPAPTPAPGHGWRGVLTLPDRFEGDAPLRATADVYVGPHLLARDLRFEAPPVRPLGAACDPARITDACAPETLCDEGTCARIATPRVVGLRARGHQGGVSLSFEGHAGDATIVRYDIRTTRGGFVSLREWGAIPRWHPIPFRDAPIVGSIEADGGVHRAQLTFGGRFTGRAGQDPVSVTVTAIDAWHWQHAATVGIEPALPLPVEAGATCDPFAVDFECPAGFVCDVADGSEGFACHALDACPNPLIALDEQGLEARWTDAPSPLAVFSCSGEFGERETPRETHSYAFTASRPGVHRFIAGPRGTVSAVSLRRRCDLPRTEIACGAFHYRRVSARLEAGETVHIVVQRPLEAVLAANGWPGRPDAYSLEVEVSR